MTNRNFNQIGKYALILAVSYLIQILLVKYVVINNNDQLPVPTRVIRAIAPWLFSLGLNIITSLIVYRDIVDQKIKTKYVVLATVLYRPVGVVAFLLYSIYKDDADEA